MERTIDGITLNTALATEVAHFSDGRERSDPLHVFEVLYRQGQTWLRDSDLPAPGTWKRTACPSGGMGHSRIDRREGHAQNLETE